MIPVLAVVPAFQAEPCVGEVVRSLLATGAFGPGVLVIDDGSSDGTGELARDAGAEVIRHPSNRGKGAALLTGLHHAHDRGIELIVTVDADGQHPAAQAERLATHDAPKDALVLGTRDLARAGAPWPNRCSNGISNFFLSRFSGVSLRDTQCGLRRYPVAQTLELGARDSGYAFEAEVILRAAKKGIQIVQVPIVAIYPPERDRLTHFDSLRDPWRIVGRVLRTCWEEGRAGR